MRTPWRVSVSKSIRITAGPGGSPLIQGGACARGGSLLRKYGANTQGHASLQLGAKVKIPKKILGLYIRAAPTLNAQVLRPGAKNSFTAKRIGPAPL